MLSRITDVGIAPATEVRRILAVELVGEVEQGRPSVRQELFVRCDDVSTGARRAPSTNVKAHSVPPMSSTTIETEAIVQHPLEVAGEEVGRSLDACAAEILLDDVRHLQVDPGGTRMASCSF